MKFRILTTSPELFGELFRKKRTVNSGHSSVGNDFECRKRKQLIWVLLNTRRHVEGLTMSERALFEAALKIKDLAKRKAYLDKICLGRPKLRASVDALLKAHEEAGSFLNVAAIDQLNKGGSKALDQTIAPSTTKIPSQANDDAEEEIALGYLSPSNKKGSMGRLAHYEVLQILGKGGFGTVLKAFDEKLHRMVAIKVMDPQMAATSPPRKRFLREARAAAAIRHENIVQVYSVEEQPLPYMVMEFVNGITLQQLQSGDGPLAISDVLSIGRQIASGLAAAHALGLIHRDIKPANILLENGVEQKIKITDFGLARTADDASLTISGMIAGTPMYMAPEQATGQALDHRADLFSLGSVLYQIASGRPPFRAANTVAVLRRVVEDPPRPIQEIIPETPDWLVAIISKLHAKDPNERFQSAKEVADLLERCQTELKASGGERLSFELTSTSILDRKKLPAVNPPWWLYSPKNLLTLSGTLLLLVIICAGILGIGSGIGGTPMRSLSGILAALIGIVAVCSCVAGFYFHRQKELSIAQTFASVAVATFLTAAGNLLLMQQLSSTNIEPTTTAETITPKESPTKETQVETPKTNTLPTFIPVSWHGWPTDAPKPAIAPFDASQARKHQEEWATYLQVPIEYENKLSMTFVLIPPGEFTIGFSKMETETLLKMKPDDVAWKTMILENAPTRRIVISKPYYLAKYEVTQEDYEKVMGNNPSSFSINGGDGQKVVGEYTKKHPVEMVSFIDAVNFCLKLSEQDRLSPAYQSNGESVMLASGIGYKLPTEAQWEYACRAGTTTPWFTGNQESELGPYAWTNLNSDGRSHFVGTAKSNPFDLHDMTGNVWEWCQDWHHPQRNIGSHIDPVGPETGGARILRGSDWASGTIGCCSAFRGYASMGVRDRNGGFRVSLSVDAVREMSK